VHINAFFADQLRQNVYQTPTPKAKAAASEEAVHGEEGNTPITIT
jgi:hypothetical protein